MKCKKIPSTIASKIFRNKFKKKIQNFKNYTTLLKETEDLNKCKDKPCLQIRKLNTVKMAIFPKLIYLLINAIPIKIPASFFAEVNKLNLKLTQKHKGPRISKQFWGGEKKKAGRTHTSSILTY